MMSAAQLSNVALQLFENAKAARHIAHFDRPNAAEIHWLALQIEEIADTLQKLDAQHRILLQMHDARVE